MRASRPAAWYRSVEAGRCLASPEHDEAKVYPIQSFLQIERLLKKPGMSPADGLQLLAEVLTGLDRQIEEHEAGKADSLLPF